jgi:F-box-like
MDEPSIYSLPDELLELVFSFAVLSYDEPSKDRRWAALNLSTTCRRFHLIATPLLYHSIHGFRFVPPAPAFELLARTLQGDLRLAKFCRSLTVQLYVFKYKEEEFDLINKYLHYFTEVTSLEVLGEFRSITWSTISNAVKHMNLIENLTIRGQGRGYSLPAVCASFHLPRLQSLKLYGMNNRVHGASDRLFGSFPIKVSLLDMRQVFSLKANVGKTCSLRCAVEQRILDLEP